MLCSFFGRFSFVKMMTISKLINGVNEIPIILQICILWKLTQGFKNIFGNVQQLKKRENIEEDGKVGGLIQYLLT